MKQATILNKFYKIAIVRTQYFGPLLVALVGVLFNCTVAFAQSGNSNQQVGKAASVVNMVIGDNLNKLRVLGIDDPVYALERVSAEPDSHGELILNDESKIVVGPGSEISLDDFVVAESGINSGTIKVLKGAFRFISGNAPKGTFKVTTPLSTIGIRGTLFDVYVKENGQTDVIIYSGRVNVCTLNGRCRDLHETCDIVRVASKRNIRSKRFLRSGNKQRENREYSLIENQERFPEGWRAPISSCDSRGAKSRNRVNDDLSGPGSDDNSISRGSKTDPGTPGITY